MFKNIFKKKKKKTINPEVALENLVSASNILAARNMKCWLTDGTLLGYYRENAFIAHDEDLDLGCFIDELDERITLDFLDAGWKIDRYFGRRDLALEMSIKRKGIKLDIFFFYKEKDKYYHGAWMKAKVKGKKKRNLIKYYYETFKLKKCSFYNHTFLIPEDTEKYIVSKYGENWKTPVKNWDWAFGPKNSQSTKIYLED